MVLLIMNTHQQCFGLNFTCVGDRFVYLPESSCKVGYGKSYMFMGSNLGKTWRNFVNYILTFCFMLFRPDHNLQDVRAKIFPYRRRKVKAPEIPPSVTLPVRRKERSLSSLVVSTPRVSTQSGMTGRRSKSIARKSLRGSSFSIEKPVKKEEDSGEDRPESSSSPETLNKFTQNSRQVMTEMLKLDTAC